MQQQLQSASIMAEALDVDAIDTHLDEYVFLGVCGKLGYVIHPLEGQLPGTFLVAKNFAGTKSHRCEATHERAARDVLGSVTGRRCYSVIAEYIRRTSKRLSDPVVLRLESGHTLGFKCGCEQSGKLRADCRDLEDATAG